MCDVLNVLLWIAHVAPDSPMPGHHAALTSVNLQGTCSTTVVDEQIISDEKKKKHGQGGEIGFPSRRSDVADWHGRVDRCNVQNKG